MKRLFFAGWLLMSLGVISAQTKYHAGNTSITMEGTSTMHDWHMTSEKGVSNVTFNFDGSSLSAMPSLVFTVQAETLKSDSKGLNKNAYKALKTQQYPTLTFTSSSATVKTTGTNVYAVSANGKLTISGVSKDTHIEAVCNVNPKDMSVVVSGTCKLKMSEYNISAPSFMFGAMKTGDEVTIKFKTVLNK